MNKPRLITLMEYLEEHVPGTAFDITRWRRGCGTVCCAGGWACHIKEFNKLGLDFKEYEGNIVPYFHEAGVLGRDWYGYDALAKFFGLSRFMSEMIFSPAAYAKNEQSALKISQDTSPCP